MKEIGSLSRLISAINYNLLGLLTVSMVAANGGVGKALARLKRPAATPTALLSTLGMDLTLIIFIPEIILYSIKI